MGGPEIVGVADLARSYLRVAGLRRLVLPVPLPGGAGAAFRRGVHLAPGHPGGRTTFAEFLAGPAGLSTHGEKAVGR